MNDTTKSMIFSIIQDNSYVLTLICDKIEIQEHGTKVFWLNGIVIAVTSMENVSVR